MKYNNVNNRMKPKSIYNDKLLRGHFDTENKRKLPVASDDDDDIWNEESGLLDRNDDRIGNASHEYTDIETTEEKIPYPKSVFFIVSNEFCERFSFYGMRTVLSLYLKNILEFTEADAKIIYHMFIFFTYFFPVFGAIIADSWLGKFKTIFYLSILYAAGNIVLSLAAIPPLNFPQVEISLLGLLLIALGTGGIKPCVSAFGGDQFVLPQQELQLAKFFSMFYFSINAGSLISTLLTPILRENVHCFDEQHCYSLAFGVPGILMVVSLIIFVAGKSLYKIKKPTGNIIVLVSKCIGHAVSKKIRSKSNEKKEHWLDYASDKYDSQLISDIKASLKVLVLYLPIPIFWALFDQQGTGWTFQASRMNGDIGFYTILPDQMQVVNPLLILAFIPLFDTCIYPLFNKCKVLTTPLQRLAVGGLLAAVSFALSAIVELQLEGTYPIIPKSGEAQLRIFNSLPCDVSLMGFKHPIDLRSMNYHYEQLAFIGQETNIKYTIEPQNCTFTNKLDVAIKVEEKQMMAQFIRFDNFTDNYKYEVVDIKDDVEKSSNGYPLVRTLIGMRELANYSVEYRSDLDPIKLNTSDLGVRELSKMAPRNYKLYVNNKQIGEHEFKLGGVYTVLGDLEKNNIVVFEISEPNSIHILWLIPQYVVITMAEIMFSVTGLEFSYSQAPVSMKSVMQAGWLLTTAFGNLIVIIVEEAKAFDKQSSQYFLYAGLMVADIFVFALLAMRYKYVKKPEDEDDDDIDMPITDLSKNGKDNQSFENENL